MHQPRAPSILLPPGVGNLGLRGMRLPRSRPCKAPVGTSPGAPAQSCRRFSCPLEDPPRPAAVCL